jgi:DNA-binding response OmpR family regulator
MDRPLDAFAAMPPAGPLSRHGSALVYLSDDRAALQTVLMLQEFGLTVDIVNDAKSALSWATHAHYTLVICGGDFSHHLLAYRARRASPETEVLLMSRLPARVSVTNAGVELFPLPLDVNAFALKLNALVSQVD